MSKLRRYYRQGDQYFVTCVTFQRLPLLLEHANLLIEAFEKTKRKLPYEMSAWVVIPDHFHLIIDPLSHSLSSIMQRIKLSFAADYNKRTEWKSGRVWQHRFWDHVIRDQNDFNRHVDYIHFNPVKHGLVLRPVDYRQSSFPEFRADGYYGEDWGVKEPPNFEGDYGE